MTTETKSYETLAELLAAVKSGGVDLSNYRPLRLDNDNTTIYPKNEEIDDEADEWEDGCIFRMHPADLLEQALDAPGIPWESV